MLPSVPWSSLLRPGALALVFLAAGCTPKIGDKCNLSTDCSTRGDRLCDTSQPDGYCTQFNCIGNDCPDHAACVEFGAAIPGCGFNDRSGPSGSRTGRTFCLATCSSDSDCRGGYVCADPREPPWNALVIDNDQNARSCLVAPIGWGTDAGYSALVTDAAVCSPVAPDVPPIEAGVTATPTVTDAGAPDADAGDAGDASDGG